MKRFTFLFTLLWLTTMGLSSCSDDENSFEENRVQNGSAKITLSDNIGNGITISLQGKFLNPSGKEIFYGIRKKGTNTYKRYPIKEVVVINDLIPVTAYEITLVYDNAGKEETVAINEKQFFTNNIFDFNEESNTEVVLFKGLTIYSEEKFSHILYKSDKNVDDDVEIYLVDKQNRTDSIQALDVKVFQDRLEFAIPDGLLSDAPYIPYKDYIMGIKTRGTYHYPLSHLGLSNQEPSDITVLRVINTTPHIESVVDIDYKFNGVNCTGDEYTVRLNGYFMTSPEKFPLIDLKFLPGITPTSTAVLTRVSDGKQYTIDDPTTDIIDNCMAYDRVFQPIQQDIEQFPRYHYASIALLRIPLSVVEDITLGEYKVKFTFDKDGVSYVTNEIGFTLEK